MYRYEVTIELLSETIFGSGESRNGIVNTDILIDEYGFPYFLGKTFKGYLKKSIKDVLSPYYSTKQEFNENMCQMFGSLGKEKLNQQEGRLKFSNFYLDKDIVDIFSKDMLNKNDKQKKDLILSTLTDIRFGIKIDNEKGVSEKGSLRASRVLKKGLVFVGYIECDEKLKSFQFEILEKGIASLKNLGINKSRGKGLVSVSIKTLENNSKKDIESIDENFDYIVYEVDLKQPVKIGNSQSKYDYEETKAYITGASIRGAILNKYFKYNDSEEFKQVLKKVNFYDLYPKYGDFYSFPTPNIFRISKDRDKKEDSKYTVGKDCSTVFDLEEDNERRVIKLKKGSFSYYSDNTLYQFDVRKDYRFHHSKEMKENNIFRYESISKDQRFYGVVDVSKVDIKAKNSIYKLLNKDSLVYLGGSRTSGYGKTKVIKIKSIKNFDILKQELHYLNISDYNKENLDIYFLSDAIIRDESHQISSSFSQKYIKEMLKVEKNDIQYKAEITPVIISGYNSEWKSCNPPVCGIDKGSLLRVDAEVEYSYIDNFIKNQHGDRKQDGLGRVLINPKFLDVENIEVIKEYSKCNKETSKSNIVNGDTLRYLKKNRDNSIIDMKVKEYILSMLNEDKKNKFNHELSNNQLNKMISIIDKCMFSKNPINDMKRELKELDSITQNEVRNKSNMNLLNIRIADKTLEKLMKLKEGERKLFVQQIIKYEFEEIYLTERTLLKVIREYLYYLLKVSKRGEYNESYK